MRAPHPPPSARTLLVGRDPQVLSALCASLRESAVTVVTASDQGRARRLHQQWLPDVCLDVVVEPHHGRIRLDRPEWAAGTPDADPLYSAPTGPLTSVDEAAAAVRSALRAVSPAYRSLDRDLLHVADLVVDERSALVAHQGRVLPLTRAEYGVLRHLARHPGRPASRIRIVERVWPPWFGGSSSVVDHYVSRLRRRTGGGSATIRSVRGEGYLLAASTGATPVAVPGR